MLGENCISEIKVFQCCAQHIGTNITVMVDTKNNTIACVDLALDVSYQVGKKLQSRIRIRQTLFKEVSAVLILDRAWVSRVLDGTVRRISTHAGIALASEPGEAPSTQTSWITAMADLMGSE